MLLQTLDAEELGPYRFFELRQRYGLWLFFPK